MSGPIPAGPALAVCGWSGSGKTTLLEACVPRLVERGLAVAALKHDAHGIQIDPRGKDSDRLWSAGADVVLRGPGQSLVRTRPGESAELLSVLASLLRRYDVVLVEGHKSTPLPKVWLASEGKPEPPPEVTDVVAVLPWGEARAEALDELVDEWLPRAWREPPVCGGVLVGGESRRMGRPKATLESSGVSLLGRAIVPLAQRTERVVLLGDGPVPGDVQLPRLPDPPGLSGPLAGILGAMRWAPGATWVVTACDQPKISTEAVDWLLDQRAPGTWAVLPRVEPGRVEPLLALYDARAVQILESLAASGSLAPRRLADHRRCATPAPPPELAAAWDDVDTLEDWERLREMET